MTRVPFVLFGCALLGGCAPVWETGRSVGDNVKDSIYETKDQLKEWIFTPPKKKGEPLPIASRYCYKAQTDILCYRQPMPGWEGRLVAYQGTDALPPPPPVMELMPKATKDSRQLPENRVATAKPVFAEPPKEEKKEAKDPNEPELPNSLNEQLPDPSQSPQL